MSIQKQRRLVGISTIGLLLSLLVGLSGYVTASDHNEPQSLNAIDPSIASDAADIYGNFVFPTENSVVFILTFPAPPFGFEYLPGDAPERIYDESHPHAYDAGVLYSTHIDRDFGSIIDRNLVDDEVTLNARFGYDPGKKAWGVQIDGIPEEPTLVLPVNTSYQGESGVKVRAGIFDEPFFLDLERFFEGLETEELLFRPDVDFFEGYNVHAIVIEIPKENIATRLRRTLSVWTTSHRLSGDPFVRPGNSCE